MAAFVSQEIASSAVRGRPISSFKYLPVKTANVLIVGVTGAGKTTFINTLQNTFFVSAPSVESQTKQVVANNMLFEIDGENYMLQILDTPGFDDNRAGQTDLDIEDLILNFIKRGVAHLNLILIAMPLNQKYTQSTIDSITRVLAFLGPDMAAITGMLFTYSEAAKDEDREKWYQQMTELEGTDLVASFCEKGVFYSGMLTGSLEKGSFVERQTEDHRKIIHAAIKTEPMEIKGEVPDLINKFKTHESSAKDSLAIRRYLPELQAAVSRLSTNKGMIRSGHDLADRYLAMVRKVEEFEIAKRMYAWNKVPELVDKFLEEAECVSNAATNVRTAYQCIQRLQQFANRVRMIVVLKRQIDVAGELKELEKAIEEWTMLVPDTVSSISVETE